MAITPTSYTSPNRAPFFFLCFLLVLPHGERVSVNGVFDSSLGGLETVAIFSAISGISSAVGRAHLLLRQGFRQHLFVNFKPPGKSAAWAPSMSLASKCITWMFSTPTDLVSTAMSMSNRAQAALNVRGQVFLSNQAARSNSGKLARRSLFAGGVQENHTNFPHRKNRPSRTCMHDALQRARVGDQDWLLLRQVVGVLVVIDAVVGTSRPKVLAQGVRSQVLASQFSRLFVPGRPDKPPPQSRPQWEQPDYP